MLLLRAWFLSQCVCLFKLQWRRACRGRTSVPEAYRKFCRLFPNHRCRYNTCVAYKYRLFLFFVRFCLRAKTFLGFQTVNPLVRLLWARRERSFDRCSACDERLSDVQRIRLMNATTRDFRTRINSHPTSTRNLCVERRSLSFSFALFRRYFQV